MVTGRLGAVVGAMQKKSDSDTLFSVYEAILSLYFPAKKWRLCDFLLQKTIFYIDEAVVSL
jgi:hypothetical protein